MSRSTLSRVQCAIRNIFSLFDAGFQLLIVAGWSGLDGFYRVVPGEVTVITGIPGSGKTEWLLSMAATC